MNVGYLSPTFFPVIEKIGMIFPMIEICTNLLYKKIGQIIGLFETSDLTSDKSMDFYRFSDL